MKKGYLEDIIRAVKVGDTFQRYIGGVNEHSYRTVVSRINKKDGYKHYSVAVNRAVGVFFIINNGELKNDNE